jgi:hypothetical protein
MDLYETVIGTDWKGDESKDQKDRDLQLVKREGKVNWIKVQEEAAQLHQAQ